MNINTRKFLCSHLVPPRGTGCLAFSFVREGCEDHREFTQQMKWTDAKKWALKKARELGATEVNLLP